MNDDDALPTNPDSGFRSLVGYRLVDWQDGLARIELDLDARHGNRSGVLHGGVSSALLDAAGGYAGCWCPVPGHIRRCFTVSMGVRFIAAAQTTGRIIATGRVRGGGRRIFFSDMEIVAADGRLIATGDGVYRYRRGSDSVEGEPADA